MTHFKNWCLQECLVFVYLSHKKRHSDTSNERLRFVGHRSRSKKGRVGMSKKLLVCASMLMLGASSFTSAKTGLYVGGSVGMVMHKMKIVDGTQAFGAGDQKITLPKGMYVTVEGYGVGGEEELLDLELPDAETGTLLLSDADITNGNAGIEILNQYGLLGNFHFFFGYRYNFNPVVVGIEFGLGRKFGTSQYKGMTLLPSLYDAGTVESDVNGEKKRVVEFDKEIPEYFSGKSAMTNLTLKSTFDGYVVASLGTILPGTDGKLSFSVIGGVGFERQKFEASQDSGAYYYEGLAGLFRSSTKAQTMNNRVITGMVDDDFHATNAQNKAICVSYVIGHVYDQLSYFLWPAVAEAAETEQFTTIAPANTYEDAAKFFQDVSGGGHILYELPWVMPTAKRGLTDTAKSLAVGLNASETKYKFKWLVGARLEYFVNSSCFIRFEYALERVNKFELRGSVDQYVQNGRQYLDVMNAAVASGKADPTLMTYTVKIDSESKALLGFMHDEAEVKKMHEAWTKNSNEAFGDTWGKVESISMGYTAYKLTAASQFNHIFSLGIGWLF